MTDNTSTNKLKVEKVVNLIDDDSAPLCDYNGSKDGKPVFQTRDLNEWKEYAMKKKLININGSKPCAMCGIKVDYVQMPVFKKPLCPECKADVDADSDSIVLVGEEKKK